MTKAKNLAILLFDDVEVLDFCGPFEVFSVANKQLDAFNVYTMAQQSPVIACGGLSINPKYSLDSCPSPDVLLVPGGIGTRKLIMDEQLIDRITQIAKQAEFVLSVCTGSLLLGKAGLLDGLEATTHHVAYDLLRQTAPNCTVHEDKRFIDNGKIITSAGIAAGIDMSLHMLERLLGPDVAKATANHMEYTWVGRDRD